jgi:catechol 2,3-dioxygenase-like lactoylglutathione lyase family enzyme
MESMMKGFSHIGLATLDMDGTLAFYRDVLSFKVERYDRIELTDGGTMRHLFLNCGKEELISFVGPEQVPSLSEWDTGINRGLKVPRGFYHFAFAADNEKELLERQANLIINDINVSPVLDHDWCKSIYFDDPINGLSLEYSVYSRPFNEDDRTLSTRFKAPLSLFNYETDTMIMSEAARWEVLEARGLGKKDDDN